jgi:hypothetical protein
METFTIQLEALAFDTVTSNVAWISGSQLFFGTVEGSWVTGKRVLDGLDPFPINPRLGGRILAIDTRANIATRN